jgi:hypothetical protein
MVSGTIDDSTSGSCLIPDAMGGFAPKKDEYDSEEVET